MAFMLGMYLSATSFKEGPNCLHVQIVDNPGAEIKSYDIPLPHIGRMTDDPDDQWLRDVLVAAIEAL